MLINPIIKVEENITETYTLNSQITKNKISQTFQISVPMEIQKEIMRMKAGIQGY